MENEEMRSSDVEEEQQKFTSQNAPTDSCD